MKKETLYAALLLSATFALTSLGLLFLNVTRQVSGAGEYVDRKIDPVLSSTRRALEHISGAALDTELMIQTVREGYDDTYYDQKATIESTAALVRQAHETLRVITEETRGISTDAKQSIRIASLEFEKTGTEVRTVLPALKGTLDGITQLTATLDKQLQQGSPKALATIDALNKSLEDLDRLIANPSNAAILANSAAITHNLDESTKSVDAALRPLREKAGLLKTVLKYAAGMLKVTLPVF